jgi:hypothetical protein|tara:strand:+ start:57 stop:791 length:735 start_codon:yes stop_codon:yes gene_type:complete
MKQKFLAYQQDFLNFLKRHGLTKRIGGYLFIGYVLAFIYISTGMSKPITLEKVIALFGLTAFLYFGIIFATYAAFHYFIRDTYRDSKPTFYIVGLLSIFAVYFFSAPSYNPYYEEGTYAPCGEWDECSHNIMAADDWQAICDGIDNSSVGFKNSIFGFTGISSDTPLRAIVQNGYDPSFTFSSYKYASGNVSCDFKTRVKGSYKGTDYNKEVEGKVSRILVTEEGILAHAANYSQVTAYVTKKK